MKPLRLKIEGMHCGGCVNRVTLALNRVPGLQVEKVEVGSAELRYDESVVQPQAIAEAVTKIGFDAHAEVG